MTDKPPAARRAPKRRTATPAAAKRQTATPTGVKRPPKRAKKTLGDDFLAAVRADFRIHGAGVIAAVRADKPDQYLKIVLSVLPKDLPNGLLVSINQLDGLSDDEIRSRIRGLEAVLKPFLEEPGSEDGVSGAAGGTGAPPPH